MFVLWTLSAGWARSA